MLGSTTRQFLQRIPGARLAVRWLRRTRERVRPFPAPHYGPTPPRVSSGDPLDLDLAPSVPTLAAAAMSDEAIDFVCGLLARLTPREGSATGQYFYRWAQARYGKHWRHADILTALWAAATLIRPSSYLEVGVHRGRSAAVVGAVCPSCTIYGLDAWIPEYAGVSNPGPDFVRSELRAVGHCGDVVLVSGDSCKTLPAFLRQHPALYFDLITIDGDKSVLGVATDFANALPRLKVGGVLVFDDLPAVPVLGRVWERLIRRDRRYVSWEFGHGGLGVAMAVRLG